jgi:predicted ArsR family transcriptional regulator
MARRKLRSDSHRPDVLKLFKRAGRCGTYVANVAENVGISKQAAFNHVEYLRKRGKLVVLGKAGNTRVYALK